MASTDPEILARTGISTRVFTAPRDAVFDAYANPDKLVRWWGPAGFSIETESMDMREGGQWVFVTVGPDGKRYKNLQIFDRIDRPNEMVFNHRAGPLYRGTVVFEDAPGGTRVTMFWTFDSKEVTVKLRPIIVQGNEENFDRMWAVVQEG